MMANERFPWRFSVGGFCLGALLMWCSAPAERLANADVRRITPSQPEQHFKSGGRLAENVLQEMLVVLKRIDERLERLEKLAPPSGRGGALPATSSHPNSNSPDGLPELKVRRSP